MRMLTTVERPPCLKSLARRIALATTCLTIVPLTAGAQGESERVIWRSLIGATAFDVRARVPGTVRVGLADDGGPMTLEFRATDTRRLADSAVRLMGNRRRRRAWTVRMEEPGARAGVVSLSFRPDGDSLRPYLFFASDDAVRQVRESLTAAEARMVAQRLRVAAATASPPAARQRRPNARRPAPS